MHACSSKGGLSSYWQLLHWEGLQTWTKYKKEMCLRLSNSSDGGLVGFRPTFCQEKLEKVDEAGSQRKVSEVNEELSRHQGLQVLAS